MVVESNCDEESAIEVDNVVVMARASSPYEAFAKAMVET